MSPSSSSSSWNVGWSPIQVVVCNHGLEAEVVVSKTDANPGRRYFRCRFWRNDDCKYFRWIDSWLSPTQERHFQSLKSERDSLDEKLKESKLMEGILQEKVVRISEECEALKLSIEELRKLIRKLKFVILFLCIVIWLVM